MDGGGNAMLDVIYVGMIVLIFCLFRAYVTFTDRV